MNIIDSTIINVINHFSRLSGTVDSTVILISENHLTKGTFLLLIVWWGWFKSNKNQVSVRMHMISTIFSCFISMILARSMALSLPFRLRPLNDNSIDFLIPYGMQPTAYETWSAFPSDHATLFYALCTGIVFVSKKAGILAFIYTTLFICLPRIYLGLHFPTDIIGGAFIGIMIAILCNKTTFNEKFSSPILTWSVAKPELFYPVFFLITYQIADMFEHSRAIMEFVYSTAKAILA